MAKKIKSIDFLPEYLRTDKNEKFLSSTIDQLIEPPQIERIDGFIGSKLTPTYVSTTDNYIPEVLELRRNYQLNPALVVKDEYNEVKDVVAIDDLVNQIATEGGINNNFDRLFRTQRYSFDPFIDWDKFINYQNYYWLTTGPSVITITGTKSSSISTYSVKDNNTDTGWIFTPDGFTEDPLITLYRNTEVSFIINSQHKFYIKNFPSLGTNDLYNTGVLGNGISSGTVSIIVNNDTPAVLYYSTDDNPYYIGEINVKSETENSFIDVEQDILNKVEYTSGNNVTLSNGMKIKFAGEVQPAEYRNREFFVEGVGTSIKLIETSLLTVSENLSPEYNDNFDAEPFDLYPFDNFKRLPITPEYVTINKASNDLNPWTRYNRWFHKDIIKVSAAINGQTPVYPTDKRAQRPIIEFKSNLKLYNFGTTGYRNVDLFDNDTTDVFSIVENSFGYYVDGVLLEQGHRVIFNADRDLDVRNKIYQVNFVTIFNTELRRAESKLQLIPLIDEPIVEGVSITITQGNTYNGTSWWYNNSEWIFAQQHTQLNQAPLFDLFDSNKISYSDTTTYNSSFRGNKLFGYETGPIYDNVLNLNVKYKSNAAAGIGSWLFANYFSSDTFNIIENSVVTPVLSSNTFVKINDSAESYLENIWKTTNQYNIPILQFDSVSSTTSTFQIIAIDKPTTKTFDTEVFVNNKKLKNTEYILTNTNFKSFVQFNTSVSAGSNVLLKIRTLGPDNENGWYEPPLSLTNNPLNGNINSSSFSELSAHFESMIQGNTEYSEIQLEQKNIRDIANIASNGTRLISNVNPLSFAQFFIGIKEHSLLDAIEKSADQYNQFKIAFLKKLTEIDISLEPALAIDIILKDLNKDKDINSSWHLSDMVAYGADKITRSWTVSDVRNVVYPITKDFDLTNLSNRSVLVYLNGEQLIYGYDYEFTIDSAVKFLIPLTKGDSIVIDDYNDTSGSYVPATPSKLGLYPKYTPSIYFDDTYVSGPVKVIQGHDGSITVAYNDYRDNVILELEKRIYNNIKGNFKSEILDINEILPNAFKTDNLYSLEEVNTVLQQDFIKWVGFYGIDYVNNPSFDQNDPWTYNYKDSYNNTLDLVLTGGWRNIYKYFYGTDRPHTNPWEMLGFSEKPIWWEDQYGSAPYTSGNIFLWEDLEAGIIRQGDRQGTHSIYARPGLITCLPVDQYGNLLNPTVNLITNLTPFNIRQTWIFGDQGPGETAWRRSSYWPFAVQKLLALTQPATYSSLFYDPSRVSKNTVGQWTYGNDKKYLNPKNVEIFGYNGTLTNGYSVYISEIGRQRITSYLSNLKLDLENIDYNLFYKVGGFVNKQKIQLLIDAVAPDSNNLGSILPQEDYNLILNVSNPVKSISISGIVIQKSSDGFIVKGYDTYNPYFNVFDPIRNNLTPSITVGGISESFTNWEPASTARETGLTVEETTTAKAGSGNHFYSAGQIVKYENKFYRVKVDHLAESTFDNALYQVIPNLPVKGGSTVQIAINFTKTSRKIPYGTKLSTIQEVYDFIVGYGKWLETQGFIFDKFDSDLGEALNWDLSSREFLFWATQNWAIDSIITLSPFAVELKYSFPTSVVDNVFDNFYTYSIKNASGLPFPQEFLNVSRKDGICTFNVTGSQNGIYFATINSVQKEHAIIFNNTTVFNDTIYDIETGYRQIRMKLSGFRTSGWDGDYYSPGFIYDNVKIKNWEKFVNYKYSEVVKYSGRYYIAAKNIQGRQYFETSDGWVLLNKKPVAGLLPNFDYKITQFEDFYSLDIDNFDSAQQKMAQHLIGYTPRVYLNNIFTNPIAQYKFYQGFIKEKGTKNAVNKIAKASIFNRQGEISYNEEWAFRIGHYGSFSSFEELEIPLIEGSFLENPQIITFVDSLPTATNDLINYVTPNQLTIKSVDYNSNAVFATTSTDVFEFNFAGYVNTNDVSYQIYNEVFLLSYEDNREFIEGDTFWLGFAENGDWKILRYDRMQDVSIVGLDLTIGSALTFITNDQHGLSEGDFVSITQFNDLLDNIYRVKTVPSNEQFTVETTITSIASVSTSIGGALFKFTSARHGLFDELPSNDKMLQYPIGSKFWVDNNEQIGDNVWSVYEKIKNYNPTSISTPTTPTNQKLGYSISKNTNSNLVIVGAPGFLNDEGIGSTFVYTIENNGQVTRRFKYNLNESISLFYDDRGNAEFGNTVALSDVNFSTSTYGLMFAGAPGLSKAKGTGIPGGVRYATVSASSSTYVQEGAVKISSLDPILFLDKTEQVLLSPDPNNFFRFGHAINLNNSTGRLLIGEPGTSTTGTGRVWVYEVDLTSSTFITSSTVVQLDTTGLSLQTGSQFGYSISSSNGGLYAVGAPSNTGTGVVAIYSGTSFFQELDPTAVINFEWASEGLDYSRFGETVMLTPDGSKLFVASPGHKNVNNSYGAVLIYYRQNDGTFDITDPQILTNPVFGQGMRFGVSLDYDNENEILVIGSVGKNNSVYISFDDNTTTFDSDSTKFLDVIENYGTAYVYQKKSSGYRYILAEELQPNVSSLSDIAETRFGYSVLVEKDAIFVGAPGTTSTSKFYYFDKIDTTKSSLDPIQSYEHPVDVHVVEKISLLDLKDQTLVEFLEVIDPAKGKIAGTADQEIKFKSNYDPAVYSTGTVLTVNDATSNWLNEHVGELWWDLSTVKYILYEQGSLLYRKNNWGKTFPGSSIDIYEWVESLYLPSEWAELADTAAGLTEGISGQPRYPDNSVYSIRPIYNAATNAFTNYYYFWVKNKVTVPNVKNRRVSANQVSNIINNPTSYGLRYLSVIDNNAIMLANVSDVLVADRINLNIGYDNTKSNIPRHTEWLLLQENSPNSLPNTLLEKKLLDSLIGHDSLGNFVPDPTLPERQKYGIEIRPRQSMFKDRLEALRNVIEFANEILLSTPITGNYSFVNLNKQEPYPDDYSGEWDQIVEDNEGLLLINTQRLKQAKLSCTVYNGKIRSVSIDDPGFGYKIAPAVTILGNKGHAIINTTIDTYGRIVACDIGNPGNGYEDDSPPILEVRPFSVVVIADNVYNGKWTLFKWNKSSNQWIRSKTQKYNTTLYWNYVDYQAPSYNQFIDYSYTVNEVYELMTLVDIEAGQYVKVKDGGDGKFIILEKTKDSESGTFDSDYNLVYKEEGTIQISNKIWDIQNNDFGFDDFDTRYDQTLYDQVPDLELQFILTALKEDIFINELKVNWNKLFFKSVRYALTEQKMIDWAFKTSFINVTNNSGLLDQTLSYKLRNDVSFEEYLREVKPYHTQIRSYTTNYSNIEETQTYTTDFDLSTKYNRNTGLYEITNGMLLEYPWKSWADNYLFGVGSIDIGDPGENYLYNPDIIIQPAPGDYGSGATAFAYITSGKISSIEIKNSGSGYKLPPVVTAIGGGASKDAILYAQLSNNKVRSNIIGLKFDRISRTSNIGQNTVTDSYICDGSANEFILTWYAEPNKANIQLDLDGALILSSDYRIEQYEEQFNNYNKKYSKIVLTKEIPTFGKILNIVYNKNIELYNAVDRIINYYTATSGMPGNVEQLMQGIEYSGLRLEGLPFDYSTKWGTTFTNYTSNYDQGVWADEVSYYTKVTVASTASTGTATILVTSTNGIILGMLSNVISSTLTSFVSTGDVTVTVINTLTNALTFSTATSRTLVPGDIIEFWNYETNSSLLDTAIDAGDLANTYALGIDPDDLVFDGDQFISSAVSYAPDEMIPGFVTESIGINVYTRNLGTLAPKVVSNFVSVQPETITNAKLMMLPPNKDSISVTFNGKILQYSSTTDFTTVTDSTYFTVDWATGHLILAPQTSSGAAGYTVVGIGSSSPTVEIGVIDSAATVTIGTSTGQVVGLSYTGTIRSAYVTVNGESINETTSTSVYGYRIEPAGEYNNRVSVKVYNLNTTTTATIQAWFFGNAIKYHNEPIEEFITTTSTTNTYTLSFPPGIVEPAAANAIVEIKTANGNRRLKPPIISYYKVIDPNQLTYVIDRYISGVDNNPVARTIRVYKNGKELSYGADWTKPTNEDIINITSGIISAGDVIAILMISIDNNGIPDYDIQGNQLTIVDTGNIPAGSELRVITFNNHDNLQLRVERFPGKQHRKFKLSREILDDNYLWVEVDGVPLINKFDYVILDDKQTIQLRKEISIRKSNDPAGISKVVVTTVDNSKPSTEVLGYRIFTDIFNRTHFKRLSFKNTTILTQPLYSTSTSIVVEDSSVIVPPTPGKNLPGVVLINRERIEFYQINGNTLSQLRRATLGTGASDYLPIGTKVIDQSPEQTIPFEENIYTQIKWTNTSTNTYAISTVTQVVTSPVGNTATSHGIVLQYQPTSTSLDPVLGKDQITVIYGGRILRKDDYIYHNAGVAYDSQNYNLLGSTSTVTLLPAGINVGDAYKVEDTKQIWVYEESLEKNAVNGYTYKGLNYLEPEFTVNTATQELTLNLIGGVQQNIKLEIIKRESTTGTIWNDSIGWNQTKSLMESNTKQANFLQSRPAELPTEFYFTPVVPYFPPDYVIYLENGLPLTTEFNNPLQGL